ncbi:MAG: hypothetical protein NC932_01865, partial [Candidatus Omnitrophica bacterium]|nr:hypothetical protein [Candidatus Omnitrophota bacterium]
YMGRTAEVSVNIKGYAKLNDTLNSETSGIPEAFNKHTIYAKNVIFSSPPTGISVKGNVFAQSIANKPSGLTEATWTETISDMVHFETSVATFTVNLNLPSDPGVYDDTYTETGMLINSTYPGGISVNDTPDPAPGVYWNGSTYLFGRDNSNTNPEDFNSGGRTILVQANAQIPNNAGNVTIDRYFKIATTKSLTINKNITTTTDSNFCLDMTGASLTITSGITGDLAVKEVALTLNNNITGKVKCNKDITVNGGSIGGDVISSSTITISGGTISGSVFATGDITVSSGTINGNLLSNEDISVSGGTINGSAVCYNTSSVSHTITISGGTINSTNSDYDAAVYIHNSSSGSAGTINISGPTNIVLGENQRSGIAVVAANGTITIGSPFTINYPSDPPSQFAIVNYCGNSANVAINANNFNFRGSMYSYRNITLNDNTQTITGILVAGDTLQIGRNTSIIYDPKPYLENSRVYKGFFWGRRRYVPVPGSWQIRW